MPEIPAELLPRLQEWWATLSDGTHAIFEAIYLDAPGVVSNALSGGTWVADSPEPGLSAQLGGGAGSVLMNDQVAALGADMVVVTPFHAQLGQAVTFTWTERNQSEVEMAAYVSDIYVSDPKGETVGSARLPGAALAAGASVDRSWTFDGAADAGSYSIVVWMNSEGGDRGDGVAGPQGYRSATTGSFEAGSSESVATQQDVVAWGTAMQKLQEGSGGFDLTGAPLQEGINWLVSIEGIPEDVLEKLANVSGALGKLDGGLGELREKEGDGFDTKLATVVGLAGQGAGTGPADEAFLARLADALVALVVR